jgi:outer membrane protein assembly factor BamB
MLFAVTVALILTMSMFMISTPDANAAVNIDTFAYVMLAPDVVQVDNTLVVEYRIDKVAQGAIDTAGHFNGTSVTITKPDGSTEVRENLVMDATSGGWFMYTPTSLGTYKFKMNFPAQWVNGSAFGVPFQNYYKASVSSEVSLTVQEEPIPGYDKSPPLPTDPWTRPIYAENKGWWQVADNWLMRNYDHPNRGFCMTNAVAPYSAAPNSAHILWTKPIIFGGIGGGQFGDADYYTGLSYEQFYIPLVLEGRIIYTEHGTTTTTAFGTRVLDLYTGEDIMYLNNTDIMFAQVLRIDNPNEHGLLAYLWALSPTVPQVAGNNTLNMYDAFTGRQILTVTNVTWGGLGGFNGGPTAFGPKGEILSYSFGGPTTDRRLIAWNSTKAISSRVGIDVWSPAYLGVIDGSMGIQYNVSVPYVAGMSISTTGEGYILAQARDTTVFPYNSTDMAFDQADGSVVWTKFRNNVYQAFFAQASSIHEGIYVVRTEDRMTTIAYSIETGEQLWETDPLPNGWGIFEYQRDIAYGKVYTTGYTGAVRAYDATTGDLAWTFDMGSAGYETPYGVWPTYHGFTIADEKLFFSADEHSSDTVLWRGSKLWALNTTDGTEVWSISGMLRNPVVADGLLTAINSYDGQVYTFGKGPTATTVTAPMTSVQVGQDFTITGTVTDQSPGQAGTPAISDEDMAAWMEYLHMQKAVPADAKGVTVKLTAIDPNNNLIEIGEATSDMNGNFGFTWTPEVPGLHQIIATFAGSNSYGSSHASTYLTSVEAPLASPTPPPLTLPPTETYIGVGTGLIIVAIAIVGFLVLRKH